MPFPYLKCTSYAPEQYAAQLNLIVLCCSPPSCVTFPLLVAAIMIAHVHGVEWQRMQLCSLGVMTALRHTVASAAARLCLAGLPLVQAPQQTV